MKVLQLTLARLFNEVSPASLFPEPSVIRFYMISNKGSSEATKTVTANAFVSFDFGETGNLIGGVHQHTITISPGQSMRIIRSFNADSGGLWTFSLDTEDDSLEYELLVMDSQNW